MASEPALTPQAVVGLPYVMDTFPHKNTLITGSLCRPPSDNDEVEWQGGRVFLHLGARRDNPPRG
jgi:hypothetical protein